MPRRSRDHLLFLEDISGAIRKIESYTKGKEYRTLRSDSLVVDAVIRNFEIIGEAVKNVPATVRQRYPTVPWKEAAAFRDVLIHDYFGVDVAAVWDTIKNNLPSFKRELNKALRQERKMASPKLGKALPSFSA
ncbi:MAG: HepT-like ribonuclease domain-containing protein [Candidatus Geothermincolia bacterium]